jgi:hypothetical protein
VERPVKIENATAKAVHSTRRRREMTKIILCNREYWSVDGIVFTSRLAALEYIQGK